jgi:hypothetical protein
MEGGERNRVGAPADRYPHAMARDRTSDTTSPPVGADAPAGDTSSPSVAAPAPATAATKAKAKASAPAVTPTPSATPARPAAKPGPKSVSKPTRPTAKTAKTDKTAKKDGKAKPGRTTRPPSGRYTPPIPREMKVSPAWVPILMCGLLVVGTAVILLNYLELLPGGASNVYLLVGLGLITAGFVAATQWR